MMNLRKLVEADLETTLEGDFALPIILVAPDGSETTYQGRIDYESTEFDVETGAMLVESIPVVTLRRSSLTQIPSAGENWGVRIPVIPDPDADTTLFLWDGVEPEVGKSIGYLRLKLTRAEVVS